MLIASELEHLIQANAEKLNIDPDYVFSYTIDPNVKATDSHLIVLISEIDDTPSDYGSNHSINRRADVQIKIFIPLNYQGDVTILRDGLNRLMESRQWSCTFDSGAEMDPTSAVLSVNTHWRKTHKMKL